MKPLLLAATFTYNSMVLPKREFGRWLRHELTCCGPVYVKFGQFVASRRDFFPYHITKELANLHDNVDPMAFEDIIHVLQQENVTCLENMNPQPISVASIGQVHTATIKDVRVCVKIQKPQVDEQIEDDLSALTTTLGVAFTLFPNSRKLSDMCDLLSQCTQTLERELDYTTEANNLSEMREYMRECDIIVPRVVRSKSTSRVLIMEYIDANKLATCQEGERVARTLSKGVAVVAIKYGYIHGDLHQGNIGFIGDKVVLYDCGSVIRIDKTIVRELCSALIVRDVDIIVSTLVGNNLVALDVSNKELALDKLRAFVTHVTTYTQHLNIQTLIRDISDDRFLNSGPMMFRTNADLLVLSRTFGLLEGSCKQLYPQFTYDQVFLDVVTQADVMVLIDPRAIFRRGLYDVYSIVKIP
jgi:predicted unusual protein kinase regulating ubiquinone biosynthesis (AarF/ABC1/UbiB family)